MWLTNSDEDNQMDKTSVVQSDTFKIRLAQADFAPPCMVLLVGPINQIGRQWPIEKSESVIGRMASAQIQIEDRSISKSHAKLVYTNGEVTIIDLGSTNHTIVNSSIITPFKPIKLANNDQIRTGNIIFKFLERGNIEAVSMAETFDLAHTDPLTGINNRNALQAKGVEWFNRSKMMKIPLSVIVFDIDFFKKVNDTYGHSAGDFILKEMADVIKETQIRDNDFFARFGGEEYCLLLLGGSAKQAHEVAERIRQKIEGHKFNYQGTDLQITVSIGVSTILEVDAGWKDIFERGDKALYESKNGGRNRVSQM